MNRTRYLLIVSLVFLALFSLVLCACAAQSKDSPSDTHVLSSEEYKPQTEFDFQSLAGDNLEIRRVTEASKDFTSNEAYYVDFSTANMALSVPVSLISDADKAQSYIAMRYAYPEGEDQELIELYFSKIVDYTLYFPSANEKDVSLILADVELTEEASATQRETFIEEGYEVFPGKPVYYVGAYLVHTTETGEEMVKLDATTGEILMREKGVIDEESLESRMYRSSDQDIYKPRMMAYYEDSATDKGFVDTYFYGSFTSTQGAVGEALYDDLEGAYAENAIKQAQISYNMPRAITEESSFQPNQEAGVSDVFETMGAYYSTPLIRESTFELVKEAAIDRVKADASYQLLFSSNDDYLVNNYVSRVPLGYAEICETLSEQGAIETIKQGGLVINSRINVALMQIGAFGDDFEQYFGEKNVLHLDEKTVDQWLLGVTDVELDNPLRPYAALAVHYGLLSPDSDGKLRLYEPITRGDMCLSFMQMDDMYLSFTDSQQVHEGYTQKNLIERAADLPYGISGVWLLSGATRTDGSTYNEEEIASEHASFTFSLGDSLEKWDGDEYSGTYWFDVKDRIVTIGYKDGQYETFEVNEGLTTLTYHYRNAEDPEFDGEVYYFTREPGKQS